MLQKAEPPLCKLNIWRLVLKVTASVLVTASHWDVTSGICQLFLGSEEQGVIAGDPKQTCQPSLL